MNYFFDTLNVVTFTSIGAKLLDLDKDDIISTALVIGISSLTHRIALDIFRHYYSRYESSKRISQMPQDGQLIDKDLSKKNIKPINDKKFYQRLSLPFIVISFLISTKITEVIFKKISEECLRKTLMFLGMIVVLNSVNMKRSFI